METAKVSLFVCLAVATGLGSWYLGVRAPDNQWRLAEQAGKKSADEERFRRGRAAVHHGRGGRARLRRPGFATSPIALSPGKRRVRSGQTLRSHLTRSASSGHQRKDPRLRAPECRQLPGGAGNFVRQASQKCRGRKIAPKSHCDRREYAGSRPSRCRLATWQPGVGAMEPGSIRRCRATGTASFGDSRKSARFSSCRRWSEPRWPGLLFDPAGSIQRGPRRA